MTDVLMSSDRSPNVATVSGSVSTTMSGRTSAFSAAMTAAAMSALPMSSTRTPGSTLPSTRSMAAWMIQVRRVRVGA